MVVSIFARAATLVLDPHQSPVPMTPPSAGVTLDPPTDYEGALGWCDDERAVLVAAVHRGEEQRHDAVTWRLAVALNTYLHLRGRWETWSQARTQLNLAGISQRRQRHRDAIMHSQRALERYRTAGHMAGQARALNSLGWNYAQVGDYPQALVYCGKAVPLHQESGDRSGEANTWDSLGDIHQRRGDHGQALTCYRHALEICRGIGDRQLTAISLTNIGDSALACGDRETARQSWQQALEIASELAPADAEGINQRLRTPCRLARSSTVEPRRTLAHRPR
jgi:tetratricopeptide (TPR) repeat protein